MVGVGAVGIVRAFGSVLCAVSVVLSAVSVAYAQCTLPYTLTNGQVADAAQVMANFNALADCLSPGGATNSIQYNEGGRLGGITPLSNGQVVIGVTGQPPRAQALTAGPGIAVTNGSGGISIAATGAEAGHGLYSRLMSQTPTSAGIGLTTWLNQGGATVADNAVGVTIDAPTSGATPNLIGRYTTAPTPPYTITSLIAATRNTTSANGVGIGWYDGTAKLHVLTYGFNGYPNLQVDKWANATTFSASDFTSYSNGFAQPIWLRLADDGTTVSLAFSQDGFYFVTLFSVAKASGFLGASGYSNLIFFANPQGSRTFGTLLSWIQS